MHVSSAGGQLSGSILFGEDLEDVDWVFNVGEKRVEGQLRAEGLPRSPVTRDGIGSLKRHYLLNFSLSNNEVILELKSSGGLHSLQGLGCG